MLYAFGTIGQMLITCVVVFLLRSIKIKVDYTTVLGMLAIAISIESKKR